MVVCGLCKQTAMLPVRPPHQNNGRCRLVLSCLRPWRGGSHPCLHCYRARVQADRLFPCPICAGMVRRWDRNVCDLRPDALLFKQTQDLPACCRECGSVARGSVAQLVEGHSWCLERSGLEVLIAGHRPWGRDRRSCLHTHPACRFGGCQHRGHRRLGGWPRSSWVRLMHLVLAATQESMRQTALRYVVDTLGSASTAQRTAGVEVAKRRNSLIQQLFYKPPEMARGPLREVLTSFLNIHGRSVRTQPEQKRIHTSPRSPLRGRGLFGIYRLTNLHSLIGWELAFRSCLSREPMEDPAFVGGCHARG